jgi:hypothetical protein
VGEIEGRGRGKWGGEREQEVCEVSSHQTTTRIRQKKEKGGECEKYRCIVLTCIQSLQENICSLLYNKLYKCKNHPCYAEHSKQLLDPSALTHLIQQPQVIRPSFKRPPFCLNVILYLLIPNFPITLCRTTLRRFEPTTR